MIQSRASATAEKQFCCRVQPNVRVASRQTAPSTLCRAGDYRLCARGRSDKRFEGRASPSALRDPSRGLTCGGRINAKI